jgi:hypothetical protein
MNCGEPGLTVSSLTCLGIVCSTVVPLGAQDTLTQEFCIQASALVLCFFPLCVHFLHFVLRWIKVETERLCELEYSIRLVCLHFSSVTLRSGFYMKRNRRVSHTRHLGSDPVCWVTALTGITSWTCNSYANICLWWWMYKTDWIIAYQRSTLTSWKAWNILLFLISTKPFMFVHNLYHSHCICEVHVFG